MSPALCVGDERLRRRQAQATSAGRSNRSGQRTGRELTLFAQSRLNLKPLTSSHLSPCFPPISHVHQCPRVRPQGGALVHIYTDGSVLVTIGGVEMGQGLFTKCAQVAASTLEVPMAKVFIAETSTDKVPNASPTAASASADIYGAADLSCVLPPRRAVRLFLLAAAAVPAGGAVVVLMDFGCPLF